MKKIVSTLLLTCFFLVQVVAPARAVAPVALAVYAAAAVGAAVTSAGIGQHYIKTGEKPVYVDKAAGALASGADMIFQPTVAAYGPLSLVTAASLPAVASVMLGKDSAVGAPLSAIADFAAASVGGAYQAWKDFLNENSSLDGEIPLPITPNDYLNTPTGIRKVMSWYLLGGGDAAWVADQIASLGGSYYAFNGTTKYHLSSTYVIRVDEQAVPPGQPPFFGVYLGQLGSPVPDILPTVNPAPGGPDYPVIKDKLKNSPPPAVQQDLQDIIRSMGEAGLATPADAIPQTADDVSPPPVITAADVAAAIRNIARDAQVAAQQAAADAAAANDLPGVVAAIAAGNAARAINDAAQDAASHEAAQEAAKNEADEVSANAPALEVSPIKAVDFSPITNLTGELSRTFPFGLFGAASSALSVLTVDPVAPSFVINTGLFEKEISLSSMNGFASVFRRVFAFFLYVGTGFLVVRIYSRM